MNWNIFSSQDPIHSICYSQLPLYPWLTRAILLKLNPTHFSCSLLAFRMAAKLASTVPWAVLTVMNRLYGPEHITGHGMFRLKGQMAELGFLLWMLP